jgi:PKD domain-containing protein
MVMKRAARSLPLLLALMSPGFAACDSAPLVAPVASTISISAPAGALAPGGSTEVTAYVVEEAGTPVHDGTVVRFTATLGRVEPSEAQTRNGVARATFTAGNSTGTARITAMSGAAEAAAEGNVVEILIASTPTATLGLTVTPTNATVGQAVRLTVTPTIATGGEPPRVVVTWGDGTTNDLGAVASARDVTHVYNGAGTYTISATATAEGTSSSSTTVTIGAAGPVSVNVTATSTTTFARCTPVTLTATATLPTGDTAGIARYDCTVRSNVDSENENTSTTGNVLTRVFRTAGTKTVTVQGVTTDGRQGNGQAQFVMRELTGTEVCN